jgi:hypothetical protein
MDVCTNPEAFAAEVTRVLHEAGYTKSECRYDPTDNKLVYYVDDAARLTTKIPEGDASMCISMIYFLMQVFDIVKKTEGVVDYKDYQARIDRKVGLLPDRLPR